MSLVSWLFPSPAPVANTVSVAPVVPAPTVPGDHQASQACVNLIVSFEGLAELDRSNGRYFPYICPAGYWTIGAGHVVLIGGVMLHGAENRQKAFAAYPNGLSREECMTLLLADLSRFVAAVNADVHGYPTTQNEFDALVSLAFNVGTGAVASSSALRLHKEGKKDSQLTDAEAAEQFGQRGLAPTCAADAFLLWDKADGRILNGLLNRREAERNFYMGR